MSQALKDRIAHLKAELLSVQPQLNELARMEETLKNNEAFKKLSPAKKRVSIALDVLEQLRLKKYFVKQQTYVHVVNDSAEFQYYNDRRDRDAQLALVNNELKCEVCALGAMITTVVKVDDKCTVRDLDNIVRRNPHGRLEKYFGHKQLGLVEAAFECEPCYGTHWGCSLPSAKAAVEFGHKRRNPSARLKAIMQNIVRNNGTFKPTK